MAGPAGIHLRPNNRLEVASITVIIPTMNRYTLLKEALDSVESQTRRCDEIVVIDAGDDGSDRLCQGYPKVRYLRQQSKGLTPARNEALAVAQGDYIAMLDSDDYYEPDFLKTCAGLLDQGADVAYCQGYRVLGPERQQILRGHRLPDSMMAALVSDNCVMASFALQRRQCFERTGGYRLGLPLADDFDLYLQFAIEGFRFAHAALPLSNRRHHDGSLTISNPESNVRAIYDIVDFHAVRLGQRLGWSRGRVLAASEMRLGRLFFELEKYPQARSHCWRVVKSRPASWRGWAYLVASSCGPTSRRALQFLRKLKQWADWPLRKLGMVESRW